MGSDKTLDGLFAELEKADSPELQLRISGEAISRFNEQLNRISEGSDEAYNLADRVLIMLEYHCGKMMELDGNAEEVVATIVGELAFILTQKINPEKIPVIYTGSLLNCADMAFAASTARMEESDQAYHLFRISVQLVCLAVCTYNEFSKKYDLKMFNEQANRLKMLTECLPAKEKLFDDQKIMPTMAIDIFYDTIARMVACGIIDKSHFED